jgi:hypothetical protein
VLAWVPGFTGDRGKKSGRLSARGGFYGHELLPRCQFGREGAPVEGMPVTILLGVCWPAAVVLAPFPLLHPRDVQARVHLDALVRLMLQVRNGERVKPGVGLDAGWTDDPEVRVARPHMQLQRSTATT